MKELVNANNEFAVDLYKVLHRSPGNLFFSPYSISAALAMTLLGARKNTEKEMNTVLHYDRVENVHESFESVRKTLNKASGYNLSVANRLFAAEDRKFLDEFVQLCLKNHGAELLNVDFAREETRTLINKWVEDQTNEKIKDLIPQGVLNNLTKMVLVNAIYFKGNWENQFDKQATRPGEFYVKTNQPKRVDMMYISEKFNVGFSPEAEAHIVELPYVKKEVSMVLIVPQDLDGLHKLEAKLSIDLINKFMGKMNKMTVDVFLPKFKFSQSQMLADTLSEMGMKDLFVENVADFSGMDGTKELFVSKVIHKAFVEVNEEGTEAAAATAVVMACCCMPMQIMANHPFIFFIKDNRTNSILFLGRVEDPTAEE